MESAQYKSYLVDEVFGYNNEGSREPYLINFVRDNGDQLSVEHCRRGYTTVTNVEDNSDVSVRSLEIKELQKILNMITNERKFDYIIYEKRSKKIVAEGTKIENSVIETILSNIIQLSGESLVVIRSEHFYADTEDAY